VPDDKGGTMRSMTLEELGYRVAHQATFNKDKSGTIAELRRRDEAVKSLVEVAREVDGYGDALIARNYRPESPAVTALVAKARAVLAALDKQTPTKPSAAKKLAAEAEEERP
jgi:hypothetical protein